MVSQGSSERPQTCSHWRHLLPVNPSLGGAVIEEHESILALLELDRLYLEQDLIPTNCDSFLRLSDGLYLSGSGNGLVSGLSNNLNLGVPGNGIISGVGNNSY